jgi:hypothetical protein
MDTPVGLINLQHGVYGPIDVGVSALWVGTCFPKDLGFSEFKNATSLRQTFERYQSF